MYMEYAESKREAHAPSTAWRIENIESDVTRWMVSPTLGGLSKGPEEMLMETRPNR
jgi:hypothetical protein